MLEVMAGPEAGHSGGMAGPDGGSQGAVAVLAPLARCVLHRRMQSLLALPWWEGVAVPGDAAGPCAVTGAAADPAGAQSVPGRPFSLALHTWWWLCPGLVPLWVLPGWLRMP